MKLQVAENMFIARDPNCWVLTRVRNSTNKKTGLPTTTERHYYFATLEQACLAALGDAIEGDTAAEVIESIQTATEAITRALVRFQGGVGLIAPTIFGTHKIEEEQP